MVDSDLAALAWIISSCLTWVATSADPALILISKTLVRPMIAASGLRSSWLSFDSTSGLNAPVAGAAEPAVARPSTGIAFRHVVARLSLNYFLYRIYYLL